MAMKLASLYQTSSINFENLNVGEEIKFVICSNRFVALESQKIKVLFLHMTLPTKSPSVAAID